MLALCALAALAFPCAAQMPEDDEAPQRARRRPSAAGRIVHVFDFEEKDPDRPDTFNPNRIPAGWFLAQDAPPYRERPGFPNYNSGEFDNTTAHSGSWSVRLDTLGGSTCLRASAGTLPVFPEADYVVTAWVRTSTLLSARARVTARFTDQNGTPIPGSDVSTDPIVSDGAWTPVRLELAGKYPTAVNIEVDLLLLQPDQFEPPSLLGKHAISPQDLQGSAWFDDVGVYQLPRIELHASAPGNIFCGTDPVTLQVNVRDLTGEGLVTRLVVTDIDGKVVQTDVRSLPAGGAQYAFSPKLSSFGWYFAELSIDGPASAEIGTAKCALIWAPPLDPLLRGPTALALDPRTRAFALEVNAINPNAYAKIPEMLRCTGTGGLLLSVPLQTSGRELFRSAMDRLATLGADVTVTAPQLPDKVAQEQRIMASDPFGVLNEPLEVAEGAFAGMLPYLGQRVSRWQMGSTQSNASLVQRDLVDRLDKLRKVIAGTVSGPQVVLPWRAEWPVPEAALDKRGADALVLAVPVGFAQSSIAELARQWKLSERRELATTMVLELPDTDYPPRARAVELVQRAVLAWEALDPMRAGVADPRPPRLAIREPWTLTPGLRGQIFPEPELAAWCTITRHLGGRRIVAEMPLGTDGTRCFLLAPAAGAGAKRGGALVAWNESGGPAAALRGYFGPGPLTTHDIFGNASIVAPIDDTGRYQIPLSESPVFIEGVDSELVRFNAGISITPSFAPSIAVMHEHELILTNPWPVRITGEARLERPASKVGREWTFSPAGEVPFSIGPGQSQRIPFSFAFAANEEAGDKEIGVLVRLSAERQYPVMRLPARLRVGLEEFSMNVSVVPGPGPSGPDVVVTTTITNTGKEPRTLAMSVQAPQRPEQLQTISDLRPGESAVRRFVIRNSFEDLSGKRIRTTLTDTDGPQRLNKYTLVP
jgi:hypothetical protein